MPRDFRILANCPCMPSVEGRAKSQSCLVERCAVAGGVDANSPAVRSCYCPEPDLSDAATRGFEYSPCMMLRDHDAIIIIGKFQEAHWLVNKQVRIEPVVHGRVTRRQYSNTVSGSKNCTEPTK